jgi:hypothetical protein
MGYYDDNFGHWDNMDEEGMVEFYHKVQKGSEWKTCKQCGDTVRLWQHYVICGGCADRNEGRTPDY